MTPGCYADDVPVTVKFANGTERVYSADTAIVTGGFVVLKKWQRRNRRRKLEMIDDGLFEAGEVAWVRRANGEIIAGGATVRV
jgi:hypothetical protein